MEVALGSATSNVRGSRAVPATAAAQLDFSALTRVAAALAGAPLAVLAMADESGALIPVGAHGATLEELTELGAEVLLEARREAVAVSAPSASVDRSARAIRAYAIVPVLGRGGTLVGSIAVADFAARSFSSEVLGHLRDLAEACRHTLSSVHVEQDLALATRALRVLRVMSACIRRGLSAERALVQLARELCVICGGAIAHIRPVTDDGKTSLGESLWYVTDEARFAGFEQMRLDSAGAEPPFVRQALESGHGVLSDLLAQPAGARLGERFGLASGLALPLGGSSPVALLEIYCGDSADPRAALLPVDVLEEAGALLRLQSGASDSAAEQRAMSREVEWEQRARAHAEAERARLEEKAAELALVTAELEQRNRDLDQFAYTASHDLKAPLRGIANLAVWIDEDLGEKVDEETRDHLRLMRDRVNRMETLIDGLLSYCRAGRASEPERVDVAELVEEVVELLAPPGGIEFRIASDLPTLTAARTPLRQVFHNLIGNAIKHNRSEQPWIAVSARDLGHALEFVVADNGPGIAPEYHRKIWGLFQKLSADQVEGTGIGLALVKKIVETAGGQIALESEPGSGATFRFTWPKHRVRTPVIL